MTEHRPRTFHFLGNLIKFLAFPAETGGGCAIVEIKVAPGAGAPPNQHPGEDESFYVLDGQFEFVLEGETVKAGPGDFMKIPDGSVHAFTCVSEAPGRLLGVTSPGKVHEVFFTEAGEPVPEGTTEFPKPDGPPDFAAIMSVAERAGVRILTA